MEGEGQRGQLFSTSRIPPKHLRELKVPGYRCTACICLIRKPLQNRITAALRLSGGVAGHGRATELPAWESFCLPSALLWVLLTGGRPGVAFDSKDW